MATATAPRERWPLIRLIRLARPVRASLLLAVFAGATTAGCAVALLACSGFLLARASQHPNIVALSIAVVAVRALGIGRGISRYVERLSGHNAALRVLSDLRSSIYQQLERLSPAELAGRRGGDLVARFVSDVDSIQDLFIRGIAPPLVAALVGAVTVMFAVAVFAPAGALLALGLIIAGVGLPLVSARLGRRASGSVATLRGELAAATVDIVDGAAELIANGAASLALERLAANDAELTAIARRNAAANALGQGGATLVGGLTVFAVLLSGVASVHAGGGVGTVPLAVLLLTALAAFEITASLPAAAIQVAESSAAARRVFGLLDAPEVVVEPAVPRSLPAGSLAVSLEQVTARYPGAATAALVEVNLWLPPGRRIGVIGTSGAGKSTLAAVLLRFLDVESGKFHLGGVDVAQVASDEVRRRISGCIADAHIFDSTLRENVRLAQPAATDAELVEALREVRLGDWLDGLPDGLDTTVGAHGARISGGQRQRIALARALLANPEILVLDEPTAHLDGVTADEVMRDILAVSAGRTLVLITHDGRGLEEMDEILRLEDGRLLRPFGLAEGTFGPVGHMR